MTPGLDEFGSWGRLPEGVWFGWGHFLLPGTQRLLLYGRHSNRCHGGCHGDWFCWCHAACHGQQRIKRFKVSECGRGAVLCLRCRRPFMLRQRRTARDTAETRPETHKKILAQLLWTGGLKLSLPRIIYQTADSAYKDLFRSFQHYMNERYCCQRLKDEEFQRALVQISKGSTTSANTSFFRWFLYPQVHKLTA